MHALKGMKAMGYQSSVKINDTTNWGNEEYLHGKGVFQGVSKEGGCQRNLFSVPPSLATLKSTYMPLFIVIILPGRLSSLSSFQCFREIFPSVPSHTDLDVRPPGAEPLPLLF